MKHCKNISSKSPDVIYIRIKERRKYESIDRALQDHNGDGTSPEVALGRKIAYTCTEKGLRFKILRLQQVKISLQSYRGIGAICDTI